MGMDLPDGITAQTTLGEFAARVAGQPAPTPWGAPLAIGSGPDVDDEDGEEETVVDLVGEVWLHEDIEDELRARRLPYLATAATAAAGYGAWGCTALADAIGGERAATGTATITWVVCAGAVLILWVVRRDRVPDGWATRWWLAAAAATVWVGVAAVNGATSLPMTAALVLGAVLLSARWAAEHEVPNPSQVVIEEPAPALPAPRPRPAPKVIEHGFARRIEQAWETRVAAGDTAKARGSRLVNPTYLSNGVRWEVQLDPGRGVGATALIGSAPDLALALEVGIIDLIMEVGARETQAFITVTEGNGFVGGKGYRGPEYITLDNGNCVVPVGQEGDGDREAEWLAFEAGQGVRNGMVTGDPGGGKTALLELVALGLRSSACWRVWWGDGDPQGASSNLMMDSGAAHWAEAGADGLLRQLAAFEALLEARARIKPLLTAHPITGLPVPRTHPSQPAIREIPPCAEFPAYMWFMPEFFKIVQDERLQEARFVPRYETAIRRTRKFGLAGALDTQSALGGDFGNSSTLRAYMGMSNAFMMRTTNATEQYVVNGLTVSPGSLPEGGGYGLSANRGRVAAFRTFWTPTLHGWVQSLPPCPEDDDAALAVAPYAPLAELDVEASLAEQQAEMEAWRVKARAGELAEPATPEAPAVGVGGIAVPGPMVGKLLQFPTKPLELPAAPVAPEVQLSPKAALVLDVLRSKPRPWRTGEVATETELPKPVVSTALGALVEAGLARRPAGVQGIYEAVPGRGEGVA